MNHVLPYVCLSFEYFVEAVSADLVMIRSCCSIYWSMVDGFDDDFSGDSQIMMLSSILKKLAIVWHHSLYRDIPPSQALLIYL